MPAAVPIQVTGSQFRYLRSTRASARRRKVWCRATGLLMLAQGKRCQDVAKSLGISIDTITDWKRRWIREGVASLEDKPRSGRPPRATPRYLKLLEEAVNRGPRAYDYLFSVWSCGRLAAHLKKKSGIDLKGKRVRKYLAKLGFVYRRPKHSLKGRQDPGEVKAAERHLHALKKGLCAREPDTNSGSRTKPTFTFTLT
jgi:transposase